jgi:predicted Zn-dependent protease
MRRINSISRIVIALALASLALMGCATDRAIIGQAQTFHSGLEPAVMTDAQLNGYIQRVGDRIINAARQYATERGDERNREWMFSKGVRFHFVNSRTLNAFTTGGEHMYIYSALFEQARTEDELAAVMAHEYAHIYGRHVHSGMNRQYAILGTAAAVGAAGYAYGGREKGMEYAGLAGGGMLLAGQFVGMHYGRADETEADALGFEFYTRAGWDPQRFGDFFQQMIDQGHDKGPEMLSGHPSLSRRVADSKARAASLPPQARQWRQPPVADTAEFARLQRRSQAVGEKMPTDQSLAATQKLLQALPRSCLTPAIHDDQKHAEQAVLPITQPQREGR